MRIKIGQLRKIIKEEVARTLLREKRIYPADESLVGSIATLRPFNAKTSKSREDGEMISLSPVKQEHGRFVKPYMNNYEEYPIGTTVKIVAVMVGGAGGVEDSYVVEPEGSGKFYNLSADMLDF
jgi:hypothetical protein